MNARELERIGEQARGRGYLRGCVDRENSPVPNLAPLSGEWAGESVRELLGDLIDGLVSIGWGEDDACADVCDAFEQGYSDGFGPYPDFLMVCPDCFDWFAGIAGATESPAGECPAGVAEYARAGVFVDVSGAGDAFGRVCDTCATDLAGARFDVAVFDSGRVCADCGVSLDEYACPTCSPIDAVCVECCDCQQLDSGESVAG